MMAQSSFAPTAMGPGHPGIPHSHPMGVPHPNAGHMGGPPGPMVQGMHPGVSGPQVTQGGPMVTGMPHGGGTPAPMPNQMAAMAHMTPQQHPMFPQQNPQMNLGQMQMNQQAAIMRQKMLMQQHQQQPGMPMNMANGPHFNPSQLAQMRMGVPMQPHMAQQMQANQHQLQFQQQQRQQMMHHAAQQQAMQRAQTQQAAAAQQMQMSRSQEPTSQPPQPQPTPTPQNQPTPRMPEPQPVQTPQPQNQAPTPQNKPQPQQPQPPQQQGTPQPQVKHDGPEEQPQITKQEVTDPMILQEVPKQQQNDVTGQCILQLLLYQDNLANPARPEDIGYWEEIMQKYFSEFGSIRQQLYNNKMGDKSYQLQYPSLARFYHMHFTNGIKQIMMQSFDHNQSKLPNGGIHVWSEKASLTYVFKNDIRVTTQGSLMVKFDEMQKIEHLNIATSGWVEYIPRNSLQPPSPDQTKTSPKLNKNQKKNQPKAQITSPILPLSPVNDFGVPEKILQFLEIAEVMTVLGPLMEYSHRHPGIGPREALARYNMENTNHQMQFAKMQQNSNAMAVNGQMPFANQRAMNMQMPNQLQSPALAHLGLPTGQGSPHMGGPNHTPSPAQNPQGSIAMVHQMSAQGSNLSGSQNPSTTTSPNVSNKKRKQSGVKMEDDNHSGDAANRVKPSPKINKRHKP